MADVDYFLKIDGIEGESQDSKHPNEIQLDSWGWSESNAGSFAAGGGGGAGKVRMDDFQFTMTINKATPKLILACAQGAHIKSALLTCRKAGKQQQEYLKIKFSDLLISRYNTGGHGGQTQGAESCSFNFAKIEYEYKPQKKDGTLDGPITANYDLKKNEGG